MTDPATTADSPQWYRDAVIYELHVRAFRDANGDGIGDFKGLTEKLDYLQDLGVTALWLLPFYPSPLRDDGYDIADYESIHPDYGTMRQFKRFVQEAHDRDLKVITELVINHTSDQHPWFQRARTAPEGSPERDFYVWSDTDQAYAGTRIIFCDAERSNWTWDEAAQAYYWHRFYSHQPDLNFDNPQVGTALLQACLGLPDDGGWRFRRRPASLRALRHPAAHTGRATAGYGRQRRSGFRPGRRSCTSPASLPTEAVRRRAHPEGSCRRARSGRPAPRT